MGQRISAGCPAKPCATRELQAIVVKEGADIHVAFDGDADRCGFVDEKGERIPQDLVTALIAESFSGQRAWGNNSIQLAFKPRCV